MNRFFTLIAVAIGGIFTAEGQEKVVYLKNPSFESQDVSFLMQENTVSWMDCGFIVEASPEFQPGYNSVNLRPKHLKNYLSMVVRDNHTWDAVGQELSEPLKGGQCYRFTIYLAKSERFLSPSRTHGGMTNYKNPLRLIVWGGNSFCEAKQVLAKTDLVKNKEWQPYELTLQPKSNITHIVFHAYYLNPLAAPYNGNILLDNASEIQAIPCDTNVVVKEAEENLIELTLQHTNDLENFIALHGKNIVFQGKGAELMDYQEDDLYNPERWSKVYFSVIAKSMRHFSSHRLMIAVKGSSDKQIQRRIQFLETFLKERGMKEAAYQCFPYKSLKKDEENWLSSNKSLLIRLEPKSLSKN